MTAVEKLELTLLRIISFDSEELRAKYKERIANAKEIEKKKDNKYNEMLKMLKEMFDEWCETGIGENKLSEYMLKSKQLIKESTEI
jgi:phage repressor protein C with HTH and peptisase S24 domain